MRHHASTIVIVCLVLAARALADDKPADTEVRLGVWLPSRGLDAPTAAEVKNGIDVAVDEINRAGGIAIGTTRRTVRLVLGEDHGKPEESAALVSRMVTHDRIVALLGDVSTARSASLSLAVAKAKVPLVSLAPGGTDAGRKSEYTFRLSLSEAQCGSVLARFARQSLKARNAGVFLDKSVDIAGAVAAAFSEAFKKAGGEVVSEQSYAPEDADFKIQITGFRDKNPDVILVVGSAAQAGLIALQSRDLGLTSVLLGTDSWDTARLLESGQGAIEGAFCLAQYDPADTRPEVRRFVEAHRKRFGSQPTGAAALGYDAARVVAAAVGRSAAAFGPAGAGAPRPQAVRDQIAATTDFPGVVGKLSMRKDRVAQRPAVIVQVAKDGFVLKELVSP